MIWINNKSRANHTEWLCLVENYTSLRCPRNWPTSHIHVKQQEIANLYMFSPNGDVIWIVILTRDLVTDHFLGLFTQNEGNYGYIIDGTCGRSKWGNRPFGMIREAWDPEDKGGTTNKGLENDAVLGFTSQHHDISRLLNGQPPRHTHTHKHTTLKMDMHQNLDALVFTCWHPHSSCQKYPKIIASPYSRFINLQC